MLAEFPARERSQCRRSRQPKVPRQARTRTFWIAFSLWVPSHVDCRAWFFVRQIRRSPLASGSPSESRCIYQFVSAGRFPFYNVLEPVLATVCICAAPFATNICRSPTCRNWWRAPPGAHCSRPATCRRACSGPGWSRTWSTTRRADRADRGRRRGDRAQPPWQQAGRKRGFGQKRLSKIGGAARHRPSPFNAVAIGGCEV